MSEDMKTFFDNMEKINNTIANEDVEASAISELKDDIREDTTTSRDIQFVNEGLTISQENVVRENLLNNHVSSIVRDIFRKIEGVDLGIEKDRISLQNDINDIIKSKYYQVFDNTEYKKRLFKTLIFYVIKNMYEKVEAQERITRSSNKLNENQLFIKVHNIKNNTLRVISYDPLITSQIINNTMNDFITITSEEDIDRYIILLTNTSDSYDNIIRKEFYKTVRLYIRIFIRKVYSHISKSFKITNSNYEILFTVKELLEDLLVDNIFIKQKK